METRVTKNASFWILYYPLPLDSFISFLRRRVTWIYRTADHNRNLSREDALISQPDRVASATGPKKNNQVPGL